MHAEYYLPVKVLHLTSMNKSKTFSISVGKGKNKEEISLDFMLKPLLLLLVIWFVFLLDTFLELRMYEFGIFPQRWQSLLGIVLSPILHGDLKHIANNSLPLFILLSAIYFFYPRNAKPVLWISWILSGLMVWFFARESYHIGASGLIYAFASFIFFSGILRSNANLLALSLLIVFLYGGLVWGLAPIEERVSYEGHISGGIIGVVLAWYFRKSEPRSFKSQRLAFEDISDDLSHEIEKYGQDYWMGHTARNDYPLTIHYHIQEKKEPNEKPNSTS
jgi:membrane associated rhomboid family serine protease